MPRTEMSVDDKAYLARLNGIARFEELLSITGPPDFSIAVEEGTAIQHSFDVVLQSATLIVIDRSGILEIDAMPRPESSAKHTA